MPVNTAEALDPSPEELQIRSEIDSMAEIVAGLESELTGLQARLQVGDRVERLILQQAFDECKKDLEAARGSLSEREAVLLKQQQRDLVDRNTLNLRSEFAQLVETFNQLSETQSKVLAQMIRLDRAYAAAMRSEGRLCQSLRCQDNGMSLSPSCSRFQSTGYGWSITYQKVPIHQEQ